MNARRLAEAIVWGSFVGGACPPAGAQGTWRVSVDSAGMQGNEVSISTSISSDGRYVAFESWAYNLVPWTRTLRRTHSCTTGRRG